MRASFGQNNEKTADLMIVTKRQILRHPGLDLVSINTVRAGLLGHHWVHSGRTHSLSRPGGLPTRARPEATNGHSTDLYTSRQSTPTSIRCWPDRPAAPATSWRRSSCDSFATVYRATWLAPRLCGVTVESALPAITPHLMPPAVDRRTAPQSYWTTAVQAAASLRRRSCCCGYRRLGA